jgi:heat-inducible transcriptional repressor
MANKLNDAYADLTSSQILAKDIELSSAEQQLTDCLVKIMEAEDAPDCEEPYSDGLHFTLNQPEFCHTDHILELMDLFEHRSLLRAVLPQELGMYKVQVIIGQENRAEVIQNCSVVLSRYGLLGEAAGIIGVVGPTRMPYARTISVISYISLVLGKLVAELYGGEAPDGLTTVDTN